MPHPDDSTTFPGPDSTILYDLLHTGNLDTIISESQRFLNQDPDDLNAHFCIAIAYIDKEQLRNAKPHIDHLLNADPESPNTLLAATIFHLNSKNHRRVRHFTAEGIRTDPENYVFYYYAAISETQQMRFKQANTLLKEAIRLNPNDPDCLNLQVRLSSIDDTSAESSWRRIEELRHALKLDPHNAAIHNSLGDVLLDELDSPREAEFHYRQALNTEPLNRTYQRDLFNAVGQRNLFYRLLSIPSRTFTWLGNLLYAIGKQPWRLIFLIIGFKLVIAFTLWLALVTLLFWPAGKVYEWLLISEIKTGARSSIRKLKLWTTLQKIPRWLRVSLFLLTNYTLYTGIFILLDIPPLTGSIFIAIIAAFHFIIILMIWLIKRARRHSGKRNRDRQQKPPPLPAQR